MIVWLVCLTGQAEVVAPSYPPLDSIKSAPFSASTSAYRTLWAMQRGATIRFAEQIVGMYSDCEIYFIDRDGRLAGAAAETMAPQMKGQFHYANLTSLNTSPAGAGGLSYSEQQEAIYEHLVDADMEAKLKAGKRVVIVDTGFEGTALKVAKTTFSKYAGQIVGHYVVSNNSDIPSSRNALIKWEPLAERIEPKELISRVSQLETNTPHFTNRSNSFQLVDGKYQPCIDPNAGEANPELYRAAIADLKWEIEHHRSEIQTGIDNWKSWRQAFDEASVRSFLGSGKRKLLNRLKALASEPSKESKMMAYDLLDMAQTNFKETKLSNPESVGLPPVSNRTFPGAIEYFAENEKWDELFDAVEVASSSKRDYIKKPAEAAVRKLLLAKERPARYLLHFLAQNPTVVARLRLQSCIIMLESVD